MTNNVKNIQALIHTGEDLNFDAIDVNGHLAKDICPFNSPIYKILVAYEKHLLNKKFSRAHLHIGLSHNTDNDVLS